MSVWLRLNQRLTHVLAMRVWGVSMPYVVLFVIWAASRVAWWVAGIRFDAGSLGWYWQYLDMELLAHRLLESVWHLHSQPPLFNLMLGVALKLGGENAATLLHLGYLVMGYGMAAGIYALLRTMGIETVLAVTSAALYTLSPSALLYEHWLFYAHPVAFLLVVAVVAFRLYQRDGTVSAAIVVLVVAVILCLMRSTYHLVFLVMIAALLLRAGTRHRRVVAIVSLVGVLMVGGWYAKNLVQFGFFGASSWFGMNLSRIATAGVDAVTLQSHVAAGDVDRIILVYPFSALDAFGAPGVHDTGAAPAALHRAVESGGAPNFNHIAYIDLSRRYLEASLFLMQEHPIAYVTSMGQAWKQFLQPAWEHQFFGRNGVVAAPYIRLWSAYRLKAATLLQRYVAPASKGHELRAYASLVMNVLLMALILSAVLHFRRSRHGAARELLRGYGMVLFFVLYVGVVVNAIEHGENNRFKYEVQPLIYVLGVVAVRLHVDMWRGGVVSRRFIRNRSVHQRKR